jgi:phosphoribosylformylglycinamidine synthase subunit PurL
MQGKQVLADPPVFEVALLDAPESSLGEMSEALGLGLSVDEMKTVQAKYRSLGRDPTDIEMQTLGQSWSEHCCYKSSKLVLKRHIFGIREDKVLLREDAGVLEFEGDRVYVVKMESHNHPSAIEPYGGASTGVGGILRDIACMGAQPIALVDPLFFGMPDTPAKDLPPGTKHPTYLAGGVIAGIRDYGNRVGIPTVSGSVTFHPAYLTNCIVNAGCIGVALKSEIVHSAVKEAGDNYVLIGGRTGRDGIHGVTFASAQLTADSEEESRGAVQLGDPITKEPVLHVTRECITRGLLNGLKDLGGGGLSCVVGEMALAAGLGADVDLSKVLLKVPAMAPWEIWVSESQERMMFAVSDANLEEVLGICALWDVDASVVGKATRDPHLKVRWKGTLLFEAELPFFYDGPIYERPAKAPVRQVEETPPRATKNYNGILKRILAHPEVGSREAILRMYDHEVRAQTAIKPLHGRIGHPSHGDAAVLKPFEDSWRGLAVAIGVNPRHTAVDPHMGSIDAVDEVARNLASVGARLDSLTDALNFGDPTVPERMWEIQESARGLGEAARAFDVPFASGNVSLYNESPHAAIPPTPSLLGVGIVEDLRKAQTSDFKAAGSALYLVGPEATGMGGSIYYEVAGAASGKLPKVDLALAPKACAAIVEAVQKKLCLAVHDVSHGGVAVAAAEMALGGNVGCTLQVPDDRGFELRAKAGVGLKTDEWLFSEAPTRWLVEAKNAAALEKHLAKHGIPFAKVGKTGGKSVVAKKGKAVLLDLPLAEARKAFDSALKGVVG